MPPSLDIIIVNWNAGGLLRDCLASLPSGGTTIDRVVVVDNASTDDSLEGLEALPLPLTILRNPENRGFGAACNQGAAGSRADYLLFLNPDARLHADSLEAPLSFLEAHADVGVCGIRLIDEQGHTSRSCARFPTPRQFLARSTGLDRLAPRRFPPYQMTDWDHAESRRVDHVIGAFYMIRRSLFEAIGGFDERFFVYLEDLDLSLRVHQAGHAVYYMAEASAFHQGGGTSQRIKATRLFYSLRSRLQYARKHFSGPASVAVVVGTLLIEPLSRLALAILARSASQVRETIRAYWLLLKAWPSWTRA